MSAVTVLLALLLIAGLTAVFYAAHVTATLVVRTVIALVGFAAIVLSLIYLGPLA